VGLRPEQEILVALVDAAGISLHLPRVYVDLELYNRRSSRYGFRLGATNNSGTVRIDYRSVEEKRSEGASVFLMDYSTPITDCDDRVKIHVPTADELRQAYQVIGQWFEGAKPAYAEGWLTANNARIEAKDICAELQEGETLIRVPCTLT
jgi:hypothetical protein